MSKAVLIMDMPKSCQSCKLSRKTPCNDWDRVCCPAGVYMDFKPTMIVDRQDWCPLRELPEKKSEEFGQTVINAARAEGWNACLDAIMEEL